MHRPHTRKPLYRKVNTRTHGVRHRSGPDYADTRHAKGAVHERGPMVQGRRRGLDYTPLFRFLISRVGDPWDLVFQEAVARLDRPDPIFWLVARTEDERRDYVRVGPATYFSGLFVDDHDRLQLVNPLLGPEGMTPGCTCCTHTFNGVRFA